MSEAGNAMLEIFRASIGKRLEGAPPFTTWLDGRIVSCEPGRIEIRFVVRPEMANPAGLLHGGVQAAIHDDVIGMAGITLEEGAFMLSIDLHVNFLGKARVGQSLKARARFVRTGRRISHAVCEIIDEAGSVISRGDSNLLKTNVPAEIQANHSSTDV
jgi:uncharacterized protein (TIGR00369 family)